MNATWTWGVGATVLSGCLLHFPAPEGVRADVVVDPPPQCAEASGTFALRAAADDQLDGLQQPFLADVLTAIIADDLDGDDLLDLMPTRAAGLARSAPLLGDPRSDCGLRWLAAGPADVLPIRAAHRVLAASLAPPTLALFAPSVGGTAALELRPQPSIPALGADLARVEGSGSAAADLDLDGTLEVLVAGERIVVTGSSPLELPALDAALARWWLADFDGDGHADALGVPDALEHAGGAARWYRAESGFTEAMVIEGLEGYAALAVGDLDVDGDLDLFAIGPDDAGVWTARAWFNDGQGTFTREELVALGRFDDPEETVEAAIADLDLDGLPDVVVADGTALRVFVATRDARRFREATEDVLSLPTGALDHGARALVALGDAEGDGDVDLFGSRETNYGGALGDSVAVFVNDRGWANTIRVALHGTAGNPRALGATICIAAEGDLPTDGSCTGPRLLGHRQLFATSAQHDPGTTTFGTPGTARVDVRVLWPARRGLARTVTEIPSVATDGSRVRCTLR